jgi:ribosome-associated toxin RatA of RatAB toxin-antitoxin module
MTIIKHKAEVIYSPEQMYSLVNAVENYPEFLPWCKAVDVLSQTPDEIQATLHLARGGLHKSFTTRNRLQPGKMIEVTLVAGPFKHLQGVWLFEALPQGSRVSLNLDFEFSNKLLSLAVGPLFQQIANTLVDSFCKRAAQLYGA